MFIIVRARVSTSQSSENSSCDIRSFFNKSGTTKTTYQKIRHCEYAPCSMCKYIPINCNNFKSTITGEVYQIKDTMTCKSENIIYLITCTQAHCSGKQYVGESQLSLRTRGANHLSSVRCKRPFPVAEHFNLPNHSLKDISIVPIEQIKIKTSDPRCKTIRKQREQFWIYELKTFSPHGLNHMDSIIV